MIELSDEQSEFIIKRTVQNEVHAIDMEDDLFDVSLKGTEVVAIFILGQMQDKMVRIQDSSRDWKQIGLFRIEEINGVENPDFSNPDDWSSITLDSISFSLYSASTWGETRGTYSSVFDINEISRLKEQV